MKKLALSILLGLGLVSQIHDLTAEDSKTLDFKYLVLSETVIEDMDAFESLQKGWSTWLNGNNIKMADQTVWTDSQGYGFTASTYKSFSEIEENNDIGQGAVVKYLSESADKSLQEHWQKMSASHKNSVWKIRNDISGKSLGADVAGWMDCGGEVASSGLGPSAGAPTGSHASRAADGLGELRPRARGSEAERCDRRGFSFFILRFSRTKTNIS